MHTVRKAVITAGGMGTRQYPATNSVQKELIPLVDVDGYAKPTLQIVIEEALDGGIEELCIVANPVNAEPIRRHFHGLTDAQKAAQFRGKEWALPLSDRLAEIDSRLTVVIQEQQEGYGHAVFQAAKWVGDEPFALLLGDHVYTTNNPDNCVKQVTSAHARLGHPTFSVAPTAEDQIGKYGTIRATPTDAKGIYRVDEFREKPSIDYARAALRTPGLPDGMYLCFFGIYVYSPSIFDCLGRLIAEDRREKGEIQLTSATQMLLDTETCYVTEVRGQRLDMGTPEGLVTTQIALALRSPLAAKARAAFHHSIDYH